MFWWKRHGAFFERRRLRKKCVFVFMSVWLSFKCFPWTMLDITFKSVESAQEPGNSWKLLQETVCTVSILKFASLAATSRKMKKEKYKMHPKLDENISNNKLSRTKGNVQQWHAVQIASNFLQHGWGICHWCRTSETLPREVTVFPFHFHQLHILPKLSSTKPDKIFPSSSQTTHNDSGQIQVLTVHHIP